MSNEDSQAMILPYRFFSLLTSFLATSHDAVRPAGNICNRKVTCKVVCTSLWYRYTLPWPHPPPPSVSQKHWDEWRQYLGFYLIRPLTSAICGHTRRTVWPCISANCQNNWTRDVDENKSIQSFQRGNININNQKYTF